MNISYTRVKNLLEVLNCHGYLYVERHFHLEYIKLGKILVHRTNYIAMGRIGLILAKIDHEEIKSGWVKHLQKLCFH